MVLAIANQSASFQRSIAIQLMTSAPFGFYWCHHCSNNSMEVSINLLTITVEIKVVQIVLWNRERRIRLFDDAFDGKKYLPSFEAKVIF